MTFCSTGEKLDIRSGGLAIYGGVIGAVLGMLIYTRVRKLRAGMEESTALLQKYPNAYASLQLLVQIPTVLRSLYEAAGTEKLTFGDLPPRCRHACTMWTSCCIRACLLGPKVTALP